jgi:arginine/ornithine N-succinyltransferase beta subunit
MAFATRPIGKFLMELPVMFILVASFAVTLRGMREEKKRSWLWRLGWKKFFGLNMAFAAFETNMGMGAGEFKISFIMIKRKSLLECLCTMTLFAWF